MSLWILLAVLMVVLFSIAIIAMQPREFEIKRSLIMDVPAEDAFEQVNVMKNWEAWSPWMECDRSAKLTYDGPASGVGAKFSWDGNKKMGAGSTTIIESRPNQFVRFRLDFLRPYKGTNVADFTFQPIRRKTEVTWSMRGERNFFMKAFGLLINCEKMIGPHFDKGLKQMNEVAKRVPST